ncbi:MAG TPA: TetR/AcrR family transcriptional regulator [Streptosporangiaceae bacterium]|nr:TetR/AcrR family transcriptional regulator [Streptosporangiaceae bacterium]
MADDPASEPSPRLAPDDPGATRAALDRLFGRYQFPEGYRRIFRAAAAEFAERGFHATTTRDIAGRSGLSPAAMYVYFPSKEDLLHKIAVSALDLTIEIAAAEADRPGSPPARLRALARVLTLWHTYNRQVAHVVLYQTGALSPGHQDEVAARQAEVARIVRRVITEGVAAGDFGTADPGAAAIAVLSMCLDVARWYQPGYRRTPQQLGDFNAAAALRIAGATGHGT